MHFLFPVKIGTFQAPPIYSFHVGGHIINLGSDGSFSTLGVNKTESGIAFSVIENPVRDKFTVIKTSMTLNHILSRCLICKEELWHLKKIGIPTDLVLAFHH
jgi:hypothetical protein